MVASQPPLLEVAVSDEPELPGPEPEEPELPGPEPDEPEELDAFAQIEDLELRWRPLTPSETPKAEALLVDASVMLTAAVNVDNIDAGLLKIVVCRMVQRAMTSEAGGVDQLTMAAGPFSQNVRYTNPHGDLYISKSDRRTLGVGRQHAFTINLDPGGG